MSVLIFSQHVWKILIIISSLIFIPYGCVSFPDKNEKWFEPDALKHFATAGVLSAGITEVANSSNSSECNALTIGVTGTLFLGAIKEKRDEIVKKTYWSWKDMIWNFIGSAVGGALVSDCI